MTSAIIIRQILILATIVVIGLIACRAKVITAGTRDFLAKLIFYVTLPSMLFTSFSAIEVTPRLLANSLQALLLAAIIMLFMLFAGWLATLVYRIRDGHASIFRLHSMLGNIIYLGLPVISAQFGQGSALREYFRIGFKYPDVDGGSGNYFPRKRFQPENRTWKDI